MKVFVGEHSVHARIVVPVTAMMDVCEASGTMPAPKEGAVEVFRMVIGGSMMGGFDQERNEDTEWARLQGGCGEGMVFDEKNQSKVDGVHTFASAEVAQVGYAKAVDGRDLKSPKL